MNVCICEIIFVVLPKLKFKLLEKRGDFCAQKWINLVTFIYFSIHQFTMYVCMYSCWIGIIILMFNCRVSNVGSVWVTDYWAAA